MTEEEKAAEAAKLEADAKAKAAQTKTYSEEQFKELIAERDKAKDKLRKIEDAEKKAADEKLVAEGKTKEILAQKEAELEQTKGAMAQLELKAKAYEETQTKLKEQALAKIADPKLRELAAKFEDVNDVLTFAEIEGKKKVYNSNLPPGELPKGATGAKNAQEYIRKAQEMGLSS